VRILPPISTAPIALSIAFDAEGLAPSAVRRRFITALRLEIVRARLAGEIDVPIAEELWRALPSAECL